MVPRCVRSLHVTVAPANSPVESQARDQLSASFRLKGRQVRGAQPRVVLPVTLRNALQEPLVG